MNYQSVVLFFAFVVATVFAKADGFDINFYEKRPMFPPGSRLTIKAGINPGIPVVFDSSIHGSIVLRPAKQGEESTDEHPVFKFEWQEDKSARFYRLTPSTLLAELTVANLTDTNTAEGKEFERKIIQQFLRKGDVLQICLPPNKPVPKSLTFFIVVGSNGKLDKAVVLPEGSVAECILEQTKETIFDLPKVTHPFTAKADISVTE